MLFVKMQITPSVCSNCDRMSAILFALPRIGHPLSLIGIVDTVRRLNFAHDSPAFRAVSHNSCLPSLTLRALLSKNEAITRDPAVESSRIGRRERFESCLESERRQREGETRRDRFDNTKGMHHLSPPTHDQPPLLGLERGLKRRFRNVGSGCANCTHCDSHLIALENLPSSKRSVLDVEG